MTLLTIVQEAAGSLNQPVPSTVFGSTTGDAVLWRNLAQREGRDLAGRHDWQAITKRGSFVTTGFTNPGIVPADYDRCLPDVELVNETTTQTYMGPISLTDWRRYALNLGGAPTPGVWVFSSNVFNITPAPSAGQTISYSYVSTKWCQSSGSTAQSAWAADTDTALIPESLIALGLIWRWLRAKGMDYAEEMQTYERDVELSASRDRGLKAMSVGGPSGGDYPQQPLWTGTITV